MPSILSLRSINGGETQAWLNFLFQNYLNVCVGSERNDYFDLRMLFSMPI